MAATILVQAKAVSIPDLKGPESASVLQEPDEGGMEKNTGEMTQQESPVVETSGDVALVSFFFFYWYSCRIF